jgi:von Willebrand factor type A domain
VWFRGSALTRRIRRFFARHRGAIDTHDVGDFSRPALRARVLRLTLAAATVALVVAAAATARGLDTREEGLLPSGTTGVVVIDLSLSIADEDYHALRRALRRLIAEDASIGLVVFSDVAYELLPPGTPASELKPMLRLLIPPRLGTPVNPWTQTFRAGTRISTALELARGMLERDNVKAGSILLVSDLETAPDDVPAVARTVDELRRSSIELRVFGLSPSNDARVLFEGFLDQGAFAPGEQDEEAASETSVENRWPQVLVLLGALFFLALTALERFGAGLAVTAGGRT